MMARKWNFPHTLIDAIQCHHSPQRSETKELAAIINIANGACNLSMKFLETLGEKRNSSNVLNILNIDPQKLEKLNLDCLNISRVKQ